MSSVDPLCCWDSIYFRAAATRNRANGRCTSLKLVARVACSRYRTYSGEMLGRFHVANSAFAQPNLEQSVPKLEYAEMRQRLYLNGTAPRDCWHLCFSFSNLPRGPPSYTITFQWQTTTTYSTVGIGKWLGFSFFLKSALTHYSYREGDWSLELGKMVWLDKSRLADGPPPSH
jgi:hypothetical protein